MKRLLIRIKSYLSSLAIPFFFIVLAAVILGTIPVFILVLKYDPKLSNAYVAFGTLALALVTGVLAFFTWWSIRNSNEKEERDRKERLLNEIIEWAEDLARLNFKIYNFVEAQISKESWVESGIGEIVSQFQVIEAKGIYITNITLSSFKGKRKLLSSVKAVNKEIRELVDVSTERLDGKVTTEAVTEHMNLLRLKIAELFKEAAKIKARDIG